ncbi:hypothetical protein RHGRI_027431 [Rhododendron griersonianum]|uniref:Transposase MuDR plant domain-containing protein n=1 Tax=Rhododendron griersonianum TaxID=479676 RepID=A0AAV6J121_9ERIC|nr:hypothetical protein RHGRI_027431 [Rhododendron griersonianum]
MADSVFVLEVHHGGYFVGLPKLYLSGKVDFIRNVDSDLMSYFEVLDLVKGLGCNPEICNIYHKMPDSDFDGGLRDIKADTDVVDMFAIHKGRGIISVYVENIGVNGDEIVDCTALVSKGSAIRNLEVGDGSGGSGTGTGQCTVDNIVIDVDEVENDDLNTPMQSVDGNQTMEFTEFSEDRDMERPQLEKGMLFANAGVFRAALRQHAILNGTEFKFLKNEGHRVTAKCKNDCGWRIHASYFEDTTSFQIKSLKCHPCQCPRQYRIRHANSCWLSRTYIDRLRDDPNWKLSAIRKAAKRDHMVDMSDSQVYRAKRKALQEIEGNHRQQYWKLWDYCEMIRRTNPGSTALLKVERTLSNTAPVFQRMFVVYEAQARGFVNGCRPIIGLDACHLKGPFLGQLMHAVGRDANDQMFPIAIAAVEAELKDSWVWFLENLLQVIGRPEEHGWTFISDRQKVCTYPFFLLVLSAMNIFPSTSLMHALIL